MTYTIGEFVTIQVCNSKGTYLVQGEVVAETLRSVRLLSVDKFHYIRKTHICG